VVLSIVVLGKVGYLSVVNHGYSQMYYSVKSCKNYR